MVLSHENPHPEDNLSRETPPHSPTNRSDTGSPALRRMNESPSIRKDVGLAGNPSEESLNPKRKFGYTPADESPEDKRHKNDKFLSL